MGLESKINIIKNAGISLSLAGVMLLLNGCADLAYPGLEKRADGSFVRKAPEPGAEAGMVGMGLVLGDNGNGVMTLAGQSAMNYGAAEAGRNQVNVNVNQDSSYNNANRESGEIATGVGFCKDKDFDTSKDTPELENMVCTNLFYHPIQKPVFAFYNLTSHLRIKARIELRDLDKNTQEFNREEVVGPSQKCSVVVNEIDKIKDVPIRSFLVNYYVWTNDKEYNLLESKPIQVRVVDDFNSDKNPDIRYFNDAELGEGFIGFGNDFHDSNGDGLIELVRNELKGIKKDPVTYSSREKVIIELSFQKTFPNGKVEYALFDSDGKVVEEFKRDANYRGYTMYSPGELKTGKYHVVFSKDNQQEIRKVDFEVKD